MNHPVNLACIVDDDNIYVTSLKRLIELRKLCNEVIVFRNGKDALDYFKEVKLDPDRIPDLLLLDINMPILDGWQFLDVFIQDLKADMQKEMVIYLVSSSIDPKDISRAEQIPEVSGYEIKPVRPADLQRLFGG